MPPTFRSFLETLLPPLPVSSLAENIPLPSPPSSPLNPTSKPLFLTLHVLFPNELLPALDLLDRRLVTRLRYEDHNLAQDNGSSSIDGEGKVVSTVYYVRTSQQARSASHHWRSSTAAAVMRDDVSYEVRFQGWNCTCAAFAFGAFAGDEDGDYGGGIALGGRGEGGLSDGSLSDGTFLERLWGEVDDEYEGELEEGSVMIENGDRQWHFGGLTGGEKVPMCKHLLACILVERVDELKQYVHERFVSTEEMAGWAAGWGS